MENKSVSTRRRTYTSVTDAYRSLHRLDHGSGGHLRYRGTTAQDHGVVGRSLDDHLAVDFQVRTDVDQLAGFDLFPARLIADALARDDHGRVMRGVIGVDAKGAVDVMQRLVSGDSSGLALEYAKRVV